MEFINQFSNFVEKSFEWYSNHTGAGWFLVLIGVISMIAGLFMRWKLRSFVFAVSWIVFVYFLVFYFPGMPTSISFLLAIGFSVFMIWSETSG